MAGFKKYYYYYYYFCFHFFLFVNCLSYLRAQSITFLPTGTYKWPLQQSPDCPLQSFITYEASIEKAIYSFMYQQFAKNHVHFFSFFFFLLFFFPSCFLLRPYEQVTQEPLYWHLPTTYGTYTKVTLFFFFSHTHWHTHTLAHIHTYTHT